MPSTAIRLSIDYLRNDIKFDGVVFTDDLSMAGAGIVGGMLQRVEAAWRAGCDMLLVCNAPDAVGEVLDNWRPVIDPLRIARIEKLLPAGAGVADPDAVPGYREALAAVAALVANS